MPSKFIKVKEYLYINRDKIISFILQEYFGTITLKVEGYKNVLSVDYSPELLEALLNG